MKIMVKLITLSILTEKPAQFINLTKNVIDFVSDSGLKDGLVTVITSHTTTGILVQESLECVETDMEECLDRLVPKDAAYAHAHFLRSYGATGNNSTGHLKAILIGNNCIFPVIDGQVIRGSAQDIYLAEFDGPQRRKVYLEVIGE
jgi:secondary thiamine-phosphate synthase enzyme